MGDEAKPQKVTVTNNDEGPRYVHTLAGMEVVRPGEPLETSMSAAQIDGANLPTIGMTDAPMFTVHTGEAKGDEGLAKMGKAKLLKIAEAEGVVLTGRKDPDTQADLPDLTSASDIATAIEKHRADNPA